MTTRCSIVERLEEIIQYEFKDKDLAWKALHSQPKAIFPHDWKRLALLGSQVLRLRLLEEWFETGMDRGMPDLLHSAPVIC